MPVDLGSYVTSMVLLGPHCQKPHSKINIKDLPYQWLLFSKCPRYTMEHSGPRENWLQIIYVHNASMPSIRSMRKTLGVQWEVRGGAS